MITEALGAYEVTLRIIERARDNLRVFSISVFVKFVTRFRFTKSPEKKIDEFIRVLQLNIREL